MTTLTIPLPWQTPPADANRALRSTHPGARAAAVRQMKTEGVDDDRV